MHLIAKEILALSAWLKVYRKDEVVVVSGKENDPKVAMEGDDSLVISSLVNESSSVHFSISKWNVFFEKYITKYWGRGYGGS